MGGELAKILAEVDLGDCELVPLTFYGADKTTPLDDKFYLLNFGAKKDSFLPHQSQKVREFFTLGRHGVEVWNNKYAEDGDIAVSSLALGGADIWVESKLNKMIFMSERLVQAIKLAKIEPDLSLVRCRIVEAGG